MGKLYIPNDICTYSIKYYNAALITALLYITIIVYITFQITITGDIRQMMLTLAQSN